MLLALVDHVGAAQGQVVHHPADRPFVAGDGARREHDHVVIVHLHEPVVVDGDARQGGRRFALRPGRDAHHVAAGEVPDLAVANLHAGRDAQQSEALRGLGVVDHAAAHEGDVAIELRREIHEDLHAVDARGKHRHDDLAGRGREDLLEAVDDVAFRSGDAGPIDVGAVGKQREHALLAQFGQARQVRRLAVERRVIDLEVAGVDQHARRRVDGQRQAVRHAVRDAQALDRERPHLHAFARRHRLEPSADVDAVLLEAILDQRQRQSRAVDRTFDERHEVRQPADVILVAVREEDGGHLVAEALEVRQVGHDEVDAEQIGLGEHHAGIDNDRRVAARDRHRVHAELAQAAKRHHVDRQRQRRLGHDHLYRSFPGLGNTPTTRPIAATGCVGPAHVLRHEHRSRRGTGAADTDSRQAWRAPASACENPDPLGWAESAKSYSGQQDNTERAATFARRRPGGRTPRATASRRGAGRRCRPRPATPSRRRPHPWRAPAAWSPASSGAG